MKQKRRVRVDKWEEDKHQVNTKMSKLKFYSIIKN